MDVHDIFDKLSKLTFEQRDKTVSGIFYKEKSEQLIIVLKNDDGKLVAISL